MKYFPAIVAVLVILGVGGSYLFARSARKAPASSEAQGTQGTQVATGTEAPAKVRMNLKETRPTLSPTLFAGKTAMAYQVAREIPEVLDQLYCYCQCQESHGHKSLLTCYVDNHAAG
ncbi:MAG: hypothetical protein HYY20_06660 [Candidatus Tectomicrobia bacterium]|uniref:Uncharacterized protein n=1 Tax=Tectimicrobiota bacterium TaxID=2528274 RepID=A0A932CNA6_UNCTE|nr:hypothetical protein [Candidatus Tectomicrobia bacterium]